MNDIVTCPLVDWYKMKQCDIRTCKNYTDQTQHRCLEIDRKKPVGTKQFSDSELNFYKFKERGISTRLVQIHRKNAIQAVKAIITLRKFVDWIAENYTGGARFNYPDMRRLEREYPLRIKRIGWQNWMWEYLLDEQVWQKFVSRMDGECSTFSIHQLLGIKLGRYEGLIKQFQQPKVKGTQHATQQTTSATSADLPGRTVERLKRVGTEHVRRKRLKQRHHQLDHH